jgi:hypothetical protein
MKPSTTLKSIPLVFAAAALLLAGPRAAWAVPKKDEGLSVRVISTNLNPKAAPPKWGVIGLEGNATPILVAAYNISPPVKQRDTSRITIYNFPELDQAIKDKTALPEPVLTLPVPSGAEGCLVVAKSARQGQWSAEVYDDSAKKYPPGTRLFVNLTPYRISGSCADINFDLPAQGNMLFNPNVKSESLSGAFLAYADYPAGKSKILDEPWTFFPTSRGVVFFFETGKLITVVDIVDNDLPLPEPSEKKPL